MQILLPRCNLQAKDSSDKEKEPRWNESFLFTSGMGILIIFSSDYKGLMDKLQGPPGPRRVVHAQAWNIS